MRPDIDRASGEASGRDIAAMAERLRCAVTLPRVREWVAGAKPGARQIYGTGFFAGSAAAPGVASWLRTQAEAGFVTLFQRRDPARPVMERIDYFVIRTARPWRADGGGE